MYLILATRPDLAFSVTKLAQFASALSVRHWQGVLRIMRYLKSHDSTKFMLGDATPPIQILNLPTNLLGFFDASLIDCVKTRRSTEGYVFFLNGACISWTSKRQGLVVLSSTEAEFIAGMEAAKELCWILGFLQAIDRAEFNPRLLGDNKGALALAKDNAYRP